MNETTAGMAWFTISEVDSIIQIQIHLVLSET